MLEKTLESPLDSKEIKPINPKGNQSWIFIGRTDADAPIFWLSDAKCRLIGKDSDAGKIEGRRRGQQKIRWLYSITDSMDMIWSSLQETVKDREAWLAVVHGITRVRHDLVIEQQCELGSATWFFWSWLDSLRTWMGSPWMSRAWLGQDGLTGDGLCLVHVASHHPAN